MTRTFSVLAGMVIILLTATIAVGFMVFLLDASERKAIFLLHFYLGLGTALCVLLVHSLIFTYFLGTGRWVKEVGLAYQLPDEPYPRLTRELKRQTFPPALFAMLSVIAAAAAGAGAQLQDWPWYVHALLALFTLLVNMWAIRVEYRNVEINAGVIQAVLVEVDRIRGEFGLNSNAEALMEDASRPLPLHKNSK